MKWPRGGSFLAMSIVLFSLAGLSMGCGSLSSSSGSGGGASQIVFVSNTDEDTISVFSVGSDGALASVRTVDLALDSAPTTIALHPKGGFVYVLNSSAKFGDYVNNPNASIGAYTLGDNGVITEIAGSPFGLSTRGTFSTMAITPDGKYLYVADVYNYQVLVFSIDASTGALSLAFQTPLEDAGEFTGIEPWSMAMHPSGKFLFVGYYSSYDNTNGGVRTYEIEGDGSLVEEGSISADGTFVSLAATPDGKYVYGAGVDHRAEFSINAATGALTLLVTPPADTSADQPKSLAITPDGSYLYSADFLSDNVTALKIGSDGRTIDSVAGQPFEVFQGNPTSVTVTGDGKYLYVVNSGGSGGARVTAYGIVAGTGALEYIDNYPVGLGPRFVIALP